MKPSLCCALASFVAASFVAPVLAQARDAWCNCAITYQASSLPVGTLLSSVGDVMVLQSAGYVAAAAGSELSLGSRVITGAKSSAAVRVGQDCRLDVAEKSSLDISRLGDKICVRVEPSQSSTSVLTNDGTYALNGRRIITPATLFGGLAIGAAILSATQDDDDPVSR